MPESFIIEKNIPIPKVIGRGRPKGSGFNLKMLNKMKSGDCVSDVPAAKKHSIEVTAARAGIKIRVRKLGVGDLYAIWRV